MAVRIPLPDYEYTRVPISLIDPARANPRQEMVEIEELAGSIRDFGLVQPLALRRVGARYELIAGHRRLSAYKLLSRRFPHDPQWQYIAAVIGRMDDATADLLVAASQFTVVPWSPADEARILERLRRGRTLGGSRASARCVG